MTLSITHWKQQWWRSNSGILFQVTSKFYKFTVAFNSVRSTTKNILTLVNTQQSITNLNDQKKNFKNKNFRVLGNIFWKNYWRIYWRLSAILETSKKSVWSNVIWYVKACILGRCIQYTIQLDKIQIFKTIPFRQNKWYKNALLFLSRAPTHHSFSFNL